MSVQLSPEMTEALEQMRHSAASAAAASYRLAEALREVTESADNDEKGTA